MACSKNKRIKEFIQIQDADFYSGGYEGFEPKMLRTDDSTIYMAAQGLASEQPITLIDCLNGCVRTNGDNKALAFEADEADKTGFDGPIANCPLSSRRQQWRSWTWAQYRDESCAIAQASLACGLQYCDASAIWGFNSPYWHMASISTILAGGISMGIYPTDTPEVVAYKIRHCACSIAFVQDAKKQAVIEDLFSTGKLDVVVKEEKFCRLKAIVCWGTPAKASSTLPVYSWDGYKELGEGMEAELKDEMEQKPTKVISYVYTSGTTGTPKAVMITHDNITFMCKSIWETSYQDYWSNTDEIISQEQRIISYLPLSHIAAQLLDIMFPIMASSGLVRVVGRRSIYETCYFARPYDLKRSTIAKRLVCIQPTMFLAVPRVWEKIEAKMKSKAKSGLMGYIIGGLKNVALDNAKQKQLGGDGSRRWGTYLADKIGTKVKKVLGLDQCWMCLTGAAPIRESTLSYFASLGIDIYEAYGMSEMCGVSSVNLALAGKWGTIGQAIHGVEMSIWKDGQVVRQYYEHDKQVPEDVQGEIRVRGRSVMMGYLANPDMGPDHMAEIKGKNSDAFTEDGYIRSGDKGSRSVDGLFKITGRYKELIITAGGENVAPVPIEDNIKQLYRGISSVMLVGDKRPYNIALIAMDVVGYTGELRGTKELADSVYDAVGLENTKLEVDFLFDVGEDHPIIQHIIGSIRATNKNGSCCPSNASTVKKFSILPWDFSVEGNELTPTLKLKRSVVEKKYNDIIEKVYGAPREALYVSPV